jgi:predicted ThiF/HesA family dinucleotide-utilizing enzyme
MGASAPVFKETIMSNTKATGVAYLDPEFSTMYATEEIGYAASAQGTVTQATSKSTAVTLDKSMGRITMNNASLATATNATFTLNNALISANDTVILTISGGQATAGSYNVFANALTTGSVSITLRNISGGTLSEAVVINFCVIHGAI